MKEQKNLRTTKCECGHGMEVKDVIPPLMSMEQAKGFYDSHFYGGNIKKFGKAKCPDCQKEYLLYLTTAANTYKVKDMEVFEEVSESVEEVKPKRQRNKAQ